MDQDQDHEQQLEQLKQNNLQLLARIAGLEKKLDRCIKVFGDFDNTLARQGQINSEQIADAFARIQNMELKFFPNLAGDITKLHNIIGDGDDNHTAQNKLDRRKPEK